jgi:branched-chain amino acid transport system permease protein
VAATLLVSDYWTYLLATGIANGLIFLSFKVFTSTTGLVSLAQGAFAGIAAFTAGNLVHEHGLPWGVGVAAGAAAAAAAGVVVALPTVRLRGIFLALATVAFAQLVESTIFNIEAFSGLQVGKQLPRPWGFESDVRYFLLLLGVFLLLGWFADCFRRSVVGRELQADLASGMGSRSVGIRPERGRMIAFLVAAGIAGIGGSMFTALTTRTTSDAWVMITALIWLTVTAVGGIGSMWGALLAGLLLSLNSELIRNFPELGRINIALFGAAGLLFLRRPGGMVGLARDLTAALRSVRAVPVPRRVVLDRTRLVPAALGGPPLPPLVGVGVRRNGHNRPAPPRLVLTEPGVRPGLPRLRSSVTGGARLPAIRQLQ